MFLVVPRLECEPLNTSLSWSLPNNLTVQEIFPSLDMDNQEEYQPDLPDYCSHYRTFTAEDGTCGVDRSRIVRCQRGEDFAYQEFEMEKTVATENDLVCADYFWTIVIDEFFMLGLLIGSFVFGVMSDKIGRRHTLVLAIFTSALGNLLGVSMPNHWTYALSRLVASAGEEGTFLLAFTMSLEYSGVKERVPWVPWATWTTLLATFIGIPFALGESLPPLLAVLLTDWRTFQAAVSSLIAITCIVWFFLPESPR